MKRILMYGLAAVLCSVPVAATAQSAKPAAAFKTPRNAFGQPDLSGAWSNATLTTMTRPSRYGDRAVMTPEEVKEVEGASAAQLEAGNRRSDPNAPATGASGDVGGYNRGWLDPGNQVMRVRGEPRTSILTTPNGQFPPRKGASPQASAAAAAAAAAAGAGGGQGNVAAQRAALLRGAFNNPENRSLGERCLTSFGRNLPAPMQGNGFYNNNYQFVQSRDAVAIVTEMVHDTRIIPLNAKHRTDGVRPWFGDSIGRYEGDTLVVETINFPQRQAYQGSWQNLKVTERFTRVAKDGILYQFTVEDPTMWDKPWGGEYQFSPLDGEIHEYACHEGNYALEGILAGAREEEKKIAAEAQPVAAR